MENLPSLSLKRDFKQIGLLFLFHSLTIIYGVFVVSSIIGISGTYQSATNTLLHEFLFRTGVASRLLSTILSMIIAFSLHSFFQSVNTFYARLMLACMLLAIPFQFVGEAFNITSIMLAKGELLETTDTQTRQSFVMLSQNIYNNINSISQCFWGLWLFPFGVLIYKSNFIPKFLASVVLLGGLCYLLDYFVFLFSPAYRSITVFALLFGFLTELVLMLWFLGSGLRSRGE